MLRGGGLEREGRWEVFLWVRWTGGDRGGRREVFSWVGGT